MRLVTVLYWLQAFAAPVILFGLIGFMIGNETIIYVLLGIGVVTGVILAECLRRKFGLSAFFARIYGPNELDEKINNKPR